MPKGNNLFSYFSPKPAAKKTDDVLTPKKSPNDGKSKSSPGKKDKETAAQSPVTPKTPKPKQNGSTPASASAVKKGSAVKRESVWAVGDLVWAKLDGYPWWPGMVTHHPTSGSHFMRGKKPSVHIQFFDNPPSRAWIKEMFIEQFSGSHVPDFQKGGRYWTKDVECHKGAQLADTALGLNAEDRMEKYHKDLPSTEDESEDEEEDMEDDSKENIGSKVIEKTPSKSPRKGRLPSRQAAKRRKIIIEDHASDSDEFKPPKSNAGSDDSASSGVAESEESSGSGSDSESYSELENDSPVKPSRKRKRGSTSTKANNESTSKAKGPRIKRKLESDSEEEALPEVRSSPWAQSVDDKPKSSPSTPIVTAKTKSRLSSFAAPDTPTAPAAETERAFTHTALEFLKPDKIKDAQKRSTDHPDYDKRTLLLPPGFLDKQTPAHRQWWVLKAQHFDTVFFFKVGKFYEMFHMDAEVAVRELGLIYMKGDYAHSGFPEIAYGRYADTLIQRGYKVARIEQTETPENNAERCKKMHKPTKFDKVVRREVCRVTTKGTRVYSFIDGDTSEAQAAFLLAIAEKEPIEGAGVGSTYGVCFVDTSIGEFHIGQFEDDRHCSRLRTLISHFTPVEVLHERGKISEKTKTLLNNNLSNVLREALHPGTEFWESSKTLKVLSESEYFVDEKDTSAGAQWPDVLTKMKADSDPLGHTAAEDFDLALRSLGALTWYLRSCCLDQELLSMRKFTEYLPIDQNSRDGAPRKAAGTTDVFTARQHMVLDGVTLANLDIVENSSTGGLEGTLLQRIDTCVTPFGKRLLKQWLVSPLCQPASINDRLDAVEDLMEAQDAVAMATEVLKKIPDLERLLSKIHTLGSANRSKDHPDGRAVFFEDLTYSKRKIEDLLSALSGFTAAKDVISTFKASAKTFKSKLLRQTTLLEGNGGRFPDLTEQLEFFAKAFDQQKAKTQGTITPNKGVDPEYDEAMADIKKTKNALDEYLEEQRDLLKCRSVSYFGTAKNRFQLEVPDSASKKVPDSYEVTSSRKGFRRYWTDEIKDLLAQMMDAEDRRDAALRDCLRRIFFAFDKSHKAWLAGVQCLAVLDVLISLSQFSRCGDGVMCRPEIITPSHDTTPILEIREGRHPCIARTFSGGDFIPNDTVIGMSDDAQDGGEAAASQVVLVTGPNMGGKSTLMRQVGVIITLAQLGCYAPAEVCRLTPVDRIFTRLGASDRIMAGESTFFVELSETSAILQHATKHSLVLLDELGRGTATYDGTAIACAVVQEVSQNIGCRTLFSTHYHSLVEEFSHDPNIRLGHMACMVENENTEDPSQETITFLYKFIGGACPKSYGFNAARLADIPEEIIKVATKKAKDFENTTNRIEWFRELHKLDESKIAQIQALHEEIVVN